MSNKVVFTSNRTEVKNEAGGNAYKMDERHALAQMAATGTFNGTFYSSAEEVMQKTKDLIEKIIKTDPVFVGKVALYARKKAFMKDMPAFMVAMLAVNKQYEVLKNIFPKVIDDAKMLRNFVQMTRSGALGRKLNMSAGTCRKLIGNWFRSRKSEDIFNQSTGNNPSMRDIICMAHPCPESKEKAALYAYLMDVSFDKKEGKFRVYKNKQLTHEHDFANLPKIVQEYENWKENKRGKIPAVNFQLLTALNLTSADWTEIAKNAGWKTTRMNLNTFARHGVFENPEIVNLIANRLTNEQFILDAKVYPYQLMTAYMAAENNIPAKVKDALKTAMDISLSNVPELKGKTYIAVDVSGSMHSPVTGESAKATIVNCSDVASLFAAALLRRNKNAEIIPFNNQLHLNHGINSNDDVYKNAKKLAALPPGGTNCRLPLAYLNENGLHADNIIYVSDYESWIDTGAIFGVRNENAGTKMFEEWKIFKENNPNSKLICMDLAPRTNSQVKQRPDILQIGGFSDAVFDIINSFIENPSDAEHWVNVINAVELM